MMPGRSLVLVLLTLILSWRIHSDVVEVSGILWILFVVLDSFGVSFCCLATKSVVTLMAVAQCYSQKQRSSSRELWQKAQRRLEETQGSWLSLEDWRFDFCVSRSNENFREKTVELRSSHVPIQMINLSSMCYWLIINGTNTSQVLCSQALLVLRMLHTVVRFSDRNLNSN